MTTLSATPHVTKTYPASVTNIHDLIHHADNFLYNKRANGLWVALLSI
jgi:hypothetical protein